MDDLLLNQFLLLGAVLFCLGVYGVLARRNAVLVLMSIELILNAVNINLVAFGAWHGSIAGVGVRPVRDRHRRRRGRRRPGHRAAHLPQPPQRRPRRHRRAEGLMLVLEHAWIIPLIPAASFFLILFFGKRCRTRAPRSASPPSASASCWRSSPTSSGSTTSTTPSTPRSTQAEARCVEGEERRTRRPPRTASTPSERRRAARSTTSSPSSPSAKTVTWW